MLRRGKGRIRLVGGMLIAVLVVAGCTAQSPTGGATSTATTAAKPTELRVAISADVATLDPSFDNAGQSQSVFRNLFDPLVERDPDTGKMVGVVASSWKVVDPTTWEFTIRSGMKFHNGDPVTASDVEFTINRILDPSSKSPMQPFISAIKQAKAVDANTVDITTNGPYTALLPVLISALIVPQKTLTAMGSAAFSKAPIGSGPYKFTSWVRDDHLSLEAFDGYWKGKAPIKSVTFKPIPEAATRVAALQSGQVDLVKDFPEQFIKDVSGRNELKVTTAPGIRTHQIIIDSTAKPFTDVRVRQAVQAAIDYDSLLKDVLGGLATRNCQVVSPDNFGYDPSLKCPTFDPTKAKQLLADAGFPNGFDTTMGGADGANPHDKEMQQAIVAMLGKVGIRVQLNSYEANRWVQGYRVREWPLVYHTNAGSGDMEYVFGFGFYSKTDRGYWKDPSTTDGLIDQSRAEFDGAKREKILQQISNLLTSQAAWVVIHNQADIWGMKSSLSYKPVAEILNMARASW